VIIYQRPNLLVSIAILATLLGYFHLGHTFASVDHAISVVAWSAWGYDELRYGVNWFRRSLGIIALLWQLMGLIK
jgi:hypothetical protein